TELAEGEELNTDKVNDLKTALDDLKIVDVQRKPPGLSRDLKTEEGIAIDAPTLLSLQSRGFFIVEGQLWSNEGDVVANTKDGVDFIPRFGEIAVGTESDQTGADQSAGDEKKDKEPAKPGSNRYLFVTARFNPDLLAKPELTPLPEEAPPVEGG